MGISSKKKVQVWKRALLHFFACFLLGVLTGLTPLSTMMFSTNLDKPKTRQEFAFEVKSIPTNAQQDFSQVGNRGRLIETIRIEGFHEDDKKSEENSTQRNPLVSMSTGVRSLDFAPRKLLIIVTPTYRNPFQAMYLNRLAHTLRLVPPPLLWIVVEMPAQSMETAEILRKSGVMYRHLFCHKNLTEVNDRSAHQRNIALGHIEHHQLEGIVYFADDNNVYTLELFEHLREVKRFGTWPVGMLFLNKMKANLEGPVCNTTTVFGWHTNEKNKGHCRFYVTMPGFAFNSTILWDPQKWGRSTLEPIRLLDSVEEGLQDTLFVEQIIEDESQMEGLGHGCLKVMVWHLHLNASALTYPSGRNVEKLDAVFLLKKHK